MKAHHKIDLSKVKFTAFIGPLQVLLSLKDGQKLRCNQIAVITGLSTGSVSPIVEGLVKRGLVYREKSKQDRRACEVSITAKGLKEIQACLS